MAAYGLSLIQKGEVCPGGPFLLPAMYAMLLILLVPCQGICGAFIVTLHWIVQSYLQLLVCLIVLIVAITCVWHREL